mmetsp:Transcript_19312/g.29339  ORF Transcript_19312/g.29339 Transcript_19312/m.29339 type:complete len:229 (+) Transcript_19312:161-847(+)
MSPKIAVILAGAGVYDGSEITESVAILVHLTRGGAEVSCFAPDKNQMHVVNHMTGSEEENPRNVLVESARIARGKIEPITKCSAEDFDAVVFPGGFGAAKNLSDFANKYQEMTVDPEVERVVKEFHTAKKVIGLSCIAPVIAAKLIPGVEITMGMPTESETFPHAGAVGAAKAMGANHVETDIPCAKAIVDKENLVVTCAAYMYAGKAFEIFDSCGAMVDGVYGLLSK